MHRQRYNFPMDRILIVSNVTTGMDRVGFHTTGDVFCIYQRRMLAKDKSQVFGSTYCLYLEDFDREEKEAASAD